MSKNNEKIAKLNRNLKKTKKVLSCISIVLLLVSMTSSFAFATGTAPTTGLTEFNTIIKFIAGWIGKLGMVVGFIGAVEFGFAFKGDDADGKTKGLRTLISGFVVFGITQTLGMFGIT